MFEEAQVLGNEQFNPNVQNSYEKINAQLIPSLIDDPKKINYNYEELGKEDLVQ